MTRGRVLADRDRWLVLLCGTVLAPVGYVGYVTGIIYVRDGPIHFQKPSGLAFAIVLLGLLGGLLVEGWDRGLRVAPLAVVGGALVRPWLIPSPLVPRKEYLVFLFLVTASVGTAEAARRFPTQMRRCATSTDGKLAAVVGTVHLLCGLGLQYYVGRFRLLDVTGLPSLVLGIAVYGACGVGLVALGALPIVCWRRRQIATPALVAGGWFLWGVSGIWRTRQRFPLTSFAGTDWVALRPYPDYLLQWAPALVVLVIVACAEWGVSTFVATWSHGIERR